MSASSIGLINIAHKVGLDTKDVEKASRKFSFCKIYYMILHNFTHPNYNLRNKIPRTIESFVSRWNSTNPQGLDGPEYGIWGYLGAISLYILYALYKDVKTNTCTISNNCDCCDNKNVEPQSEEVFNNHVGSFESSGRVHIVYMTTEQWFAYRKWQDRKAKIKPQAEEYMGIVDSITVPQQQTDHVPSYYNLCPDCKYFGPKCWCNILPQSEEITQTPATDATRSQNVMFADTHPGYVTNVEGEIDSIRNAAFVGDATLDEFFSRPLRIVSREWGVNSTLYWKFNPWTIYWENLRVINRISNYKLLTARLHLKVTLNGNAFHYGRALLSYNPLPDRDQLTVDRAFLDADIVAASQRPHIYLDPTNSQGGEMCVPFFYYKNCMDITSQDWEHVGECVLQSIQQLKHANGATDTVTVNVFAWATDVKFAIPTHVEPGDIGPQADEYSTGVISRPASIVANIASKLSSIPMIAPFARATEMGADAIGAVAQLFGYSRPVMLHKSQYRPHIKGDTAVCDIEDDCTKLSVSAKQELTLDPRTVGLAGVDELAINYIASRESYLTNFDWQLETVPETLLWNAIVDPALHRKQGAEHHFTAASFATWPFQYWRGSMEFRFQVVCSKYHKGRLKIVYDPSGNTSGTAEYNTAYTTIVDISDTTDFTIKCGWGQATTYRTHLPLTSPQNGMFSPSALPYNSADVPYGNGTIAVYVVNELTVPNTTINNDIEVNVFVKMGEDFEVAGPNGNEVSQLRLTSSTALVAPQAWEITPHADDVQNENDEQDRMDSAPMGTSILNQNADTTSLTDYTNHIHFGENIRSMRQLTKRYNLHEFLCFPLLEGTNNTGWARWLRPMMPYEPGYSSTAKSDVTITVTSGDYYYAQMPFLKYLSSAYGGWRGSIRWMFDTTTAGNNGIGRPVFTTLSRYPISSEPGYLFTAASGSLFTPMNMGTINVNYDESNGKSGAIIQSSFANSVISGEVPYYSQYRFTPAKQRAVFDDEQFNNPGWALTVEGQFAETDYIKSYCAAGEDFNCFFFLGAPIFYRESAYPFV